MCIRDRNIAIEHVLCCVARSAVFSVKIESAGKSAVFEPVSYTHLFCNQYFADYPKNIPDGKFDPLTVEPEWMLLSYHKTACASSSRSGFDPQNAFDESIKSAWSATSGNSGEWLSVDLGKEYNVEAVQVNFADCFTKKKRAPMKEDGGTFTQERDVYKRQFSN